MVVKRGLPEELTTLLKQLVMNGQVRIAGHVLYSYCRRFYGVDDETARTLDCHLLSAGIPPADRTSPETYC